MGTKSSLLTFEDDDKRPRRLSEEEEEDDLDDESFDTDSSISSLQRHSDVKSCDIKKIRSMLGEPAQDKHKDELHARASKLRRHYSEIQACEKVMAFGFISIIFLCTGFFWFIKLFKME